MHWGVFACLNLMILSPSLLAVELLKTSDDYRTVEDAVIIDLGGFDKALFPYLRLELDDIDVTAFVSLKKNRLQYQPGPALARGIHALRLLAVTPDGNIEEIASWQLDIRTARGLVQSQFTSSADAQITQRVADDIPDNTLNRTQAQGSMVIASLQATRDVQFSSSADFIYNSQSDQTLNGREFDVNQFNLVAEWSQAAVTLGHQIIPANSLIVTDFNRRGVSATAGTQSGLIKATAFAMRSETITGFEHGLGVGDDQHRTQGAIVRLTPLTRSPENLILSVSYVEGQGQTTGLAELSSDETTQQGDAHAFQVESYTMDKQLYLRGEYALTNFDFDGANNGFDAEKDRASILFAQYATERNTAREASNNWSVGLLHQRVGPWFHSLGNANLPSDKNLTQLSSTFSSTSWQLAANAAYEQSNVTNDNSIPTIESKLMTATLSYTPQSGDAPSDGLFTHPTLSLGYQHGTQEQITTPGGFLGDFTDISSREMSLTAAFAGDNWNWQLGYSISEQEDVTNNVSDQQNQLVSLEANFPLVSYISLTPLLQSSRNRELDTGTVVNGWNAGVTLNFDNQQDWSGGLSYSVIRSYDNIDVINSRSSVLEFLAMWTYQQAQNNKPGIQLFTTANYQNTSSTETNLDQYQVFVGVNVSWPVSL